MASRNSNPSKVPRVKPGWLALGVIIPFAALAFIAWFAIRPTDSSGTLPTEIPDQASLDGPGRAPRPSLPSVVPEDVSGMDSASQGILNYLRVHEAIPDYLIQDAFKSSFNSAD